MSIWKFQNQRTTDSFHVGLGFIVNLHSPTFREKPALKMALVNSWPCFQDEPKHDEGVVLTTVCIFNEDGTLTLNAILESEIILLMALSLPHLHYWGKEWWLWTQNGCRAKLVAHDITMNDGDDALTKSIWSWRNEMNSTLLWHGFGVLEGNWCRLLWNGLCVFTNPSTDTAQHEGVCFFGDSKNFTNFFN